MTDDDRDTECQRELFPATARSENIGHASATGPLNERSLHPRGLNHYVAPNMMRPRLISEGTLLRMLKEVEESWNRRDFEKSIEIMERACRMSPSNHVLLLDLGRFHGKRFDFASAERCFDKAIRVSPKKAETLIEAGQRCREFGGYSMADRYLQSALNEKVASMDALVKLGEHYERTNRPEAAAEMVDRALQSDPSNLSALFLKAQLARKAGQLDLAEQTLRTVLKTSDPSLRIRAWYELGGVLDRQKRFDDAMAAFLEAKALKRPDSAKHAHELRVVRTRLKELCNSLTTETLQRWQDAGRELGASRRVALLCGHPRSGTTLLEQVLDSHPDVVSVEETDIFHDDAFMPLTRALPDDAPMISVLESANAGALQTSRTNYLRTVERFLANPVGGRLLIDKNPSLTYLIAAFIRVFPESRFLVALRDPRDVCLSCFMQPLPLNQAASAFLDLGNTAQEYASLMGMWRTLAPMIQNPSIEVRYEDMVDDLESSARRTLAFLDISWDERVLSFDAHARQKTVRSPTYGDVIKPVFKSAMGRWRNYQKYLDPHLKTLDPFAKAFGYE